MTVWSHTVVITNKWAVLVAHPVNGISVLKMADRENSFEGKISKVQWQECTQLKSVNQYRALNNTICCVCVAWPPQGSCLACTLCERVLLQIFGDVGA